VTDALALARADLLPWSTALDTFSYLRDEKEFIPWKVALKELAYIRNLIRGSPAQDLFKVRIIFRTVPISHKIQ